MAHCLRRRFPAYGQSVRGHATRLRTDGTSPDRNQNCPTDSASLISEPAPSQNKHQREAQRHAAQDEQASNANSRARTVGTHTPAPLVPGSRY